MSKYGFESIQPLDFIVDELSEIKNTFWRANMPKSWQNLISRHSKGYPPFRGLANVLRLVVPGLVAVESQWGEVKRGNPWLISIDPVSDRHNELIGIVVKAWFEMKILNHRHRRNVKLDGMESCMLEWKRYELDLATCSTTDFNTALPTASDFAVLPALLCVRARKHDMKMTIGGQSLQFKCALLDQGMELVSWPPQRWEQGNQLYWWSYYLRPSLQTSVFYKHPIIRWTGHRHRWVSWSLLNSKTGYIDLPSGQNTNSYAQPVLHLLPEITPTANLIRLPLRWVKQDKVDWTDSLRQLLRRLGADWPSAEDLIRNPPHYIQSPDRPIAIVHSNDMKTNHDSATGMKPRDRLDVFNALKKSPVCSGLKPVLPRSRISIHAVDSAKWRHRVAASLCVAPKKREVHIEIRFQDEAMRNCLIEQIRVEAHSMGLHESDTSGHFESSGLILDVSAESLGPIGDRLTEIDNEKMRVQRIKKDLAQPTQPTVTLVELGGREQYGAKADPKRALRRGMASVGRPTQFITPLASNMNSGSQNSDTDDVRVRNALWDVWRQTGLLPGCLEEMIPDTLAIPKETMVLAVWMHKLTGDFDRGLLPVCVLFRPDSHEVLAKCYGQHNWGSYPEALTHLASADFQGGMVKNRAVVWIRQVLKDCTGGPLLLLCNAENLRHVWVWLKNGNLQRDQLAWVNDQAMRPPTGLRVAVLRSGDRIGEVSQYVAIHKTDGRPGMPGGLFSWSNDEDNRVFLSLAEKARTVRGRVGDSAMDNPSASGSVTAIKEIVLPVLQEGDDPNAWAEFVHRLRAPWVRSVADANVLPRPLHLASRMEEYVRVNEASKR